MVTVATLASATLPSAAADRPGSRPNQPRQVAERVLTAVQDVVSAPPVAGQQEPTTAPGGRDLTLLLRDLQVSLPALAGSDRDQARSYLARPTDGSSFEGAAGYDDVRAYHDCGAGDPGAGTNFCVHWVRRGSEKTATADTAPANGVPDQVDLTRSVMSLVWKREIRTAGYREPRRDAGPPEAGPNRKLDIYLADIGDVGLYGYCAPEPTPDRGHDTTGYCVLDNDYVEFSNKTPLQNLQVTAAHEFFHAVQFGYDAREDAWLMEGTATWMEDEVFDDVNDNRSYLDSSPLSSPSRPVDSGDGMFVYGTWIWWRFLSERFPADGGTGIPKLVRRVWNKADDSKPSDPGTYSLKALRRVLSDRGSTLTEAFAAFGVANRHPEDVYEEGAAYRRAPVDRGFLLTADRPAVPEQSVELDHLSTRSYVITPGDGLSDGTARLRVRIDAPARRHRPVAQLTTYGTDGSLDTRDIVLDRRGRGTGKVGFDSDDVDHVELTLTNAGHRFDCGYRTSFSCRGLSKSDDRRTEFGVELVS